MGYTLVQTGQQAGTAAPQKHYRLVRKPPEAGDTSVFKSGPVEQKAPATVEGALAQFGTGAAKGAINTAATVPFARDAVSNVADWAAQKLGASPETAKTIAEAVKAGFLVMPGGANPTGGQVIEDINTATRPAPSLSQVITGEKTKGLLEREPQNMTEEYAGTLGEFLPGAVGPGGPVRKIAQAVVPALASETAGQVARATGNEEFEPYARFAGGVIGGGVSAGGKANAAKTIAKGAPSSASVSATTTALYDKLRKAGIKYDANAFHQMASDLGQKLKSFRAKQAPLSADVVEYIQEHVGKSPDFTDFDSIRQTAGNILREGTASDADKAAASIIMETLDDFAEKAPLMTSGKVNPQQVNPLMKEAREMARRNIIGRHVQEMMRKAEEYQSGFDSGLRNQFSNYLKSNKGKMLTPEEYKAFQAVSKGVSSANAVRGLSKFGLDFSRLASGATVLPTLATGGVGYAAGLLPAAALMGAGTVARFASPRMHKTLADRALGVVNAGKPGQMAGRKLSQKELEALIIRRIIAGDTAFNASGMRGEPSMSSVLAP